MSRIVSPRCGLRAWPTRIEGKFCTQTPDKPCSGGSNGAARSSVMVTPTPVCLEKNSALAQCVLPIPKYKQDVKGEQDEVDVNFCFCILNYLDIYDSICDFLFFQRAMKENNIDLNEVDREILGTPDEKKPTSSDEN